MTNGLFPGITDLAREVRYRYFDQPLFERARQQIYEQVEEHLAYMAANPECRGPPRENPCASRMSAAADRTDLRPVRNR